MSGSHQSDATAVEGKKSSKCLYYVRNIATFLVSHIGLVSLVVGYCIMGAFTFEKLEATNELLVKRNMTVVREKVTNDLWDITAEMPVLFQENWTISVTQKLLAFEEHLIESIKKKGWDGSEDEKKLQWTYAGALFYSIILITTIGYGHIAPKTQWGKVVTIFYAVLGIPLMLLCLANIGDAMAHSFRFLYWKVCCYVCTRKPKKTRLRRTRTLRSSSGRASSRAASRPTSLRRSQRASQRSADSALSDSALSRSSYSSDINVDASKSGRYYDDADHDLEMMPVAVPQRGRRSQHGSGRRHRPELDFPPPPPTPTSPLTKHAPAAGPGAGSSADPASAMESGFFNKYAVDDNSGQRGGAENDSTENETGVRPGGPGRYPGRGSGRLSRLTEQDEVDDDVEDVDGYYGDYPDYTDCSDVDEDEAASHRNKPVPIWLSILLVVGYIFGGAFMFSGWEGWEFLDSAYFCFITLTTIGFGDFVPAQKVEEKVEVSIALCSLYLLFGIALLAMSFNLVQEEVINSVKSVAKRLGIIKDEDDDVQ